MNEPRLRFKEFSGEWESLCLGKITETITSGSRDWAQFYSKNGSKFIRMTNLSRDGIQLKLDDLKFVNIKSNSTDGNRTSLAHGDILISITAELGKIGWIPPSFGEAFINQHTALVRIKKTTTESKFIAYLLSTTKLNKQINRMNDAGAKAGLNLPTIKSIKIQLPKLDEQTKIASFLTAVDEKITQITQKIDLLARYKKGVMQQIFSQQLRFKDDDGQDFPDWEDGKLDDAFNYKNGKSFENKVTEDGEYYLVTLNSIDILGKLKADHKRVSKSDYSLITNDLIMVLSDVAHGNFLGLTDIIPSDDFVLNQRIGGLREKINIDVRFASLYINYHQKYFKLHGQGSSQLNLSKGSVLNFYLPRPCLKEQTKIANFLTALDDKISHNQTRLNALKQYKQGLLQQLFV